MIKQHLYSREKVEEFKKYLVSWFNYTQDRITLQDKIKLLDKYNEVFGLEVEK